MNIKSKKCKKCGKEFIKQPSHSMKYWEGREFCSVSCSTIGRPSYWKGKKNPYMIGNKLKKGTIAWNRGLTTKTNEIVKAYGKKSGNSRKNKPKKPFRITSAGYKYIMIPDHPRVNATKCVPEHVLIMEKHIGRYLTKEEVVHHINENKLDNRIENLKLFSNSSEHMRHHFLHNSNNGIKKGHANRKMTDEIKKKISNTLKLRNESISGRSVL